VVARSSQDVGWTALPSITHSAGGTSGPADTLSVTINNAYPGYYTTVYFEITNDGSVPLNLTVPTSGPDELTVTTGSLGALPADVTPTLTDASSGSFGGTGIVVAPSATTHGYLTIAVVSPPVTGATYTVTFTVTANQNTN
jgi:hypothetical protein